MEIIEKLKTALETLEHKPSIDNVFSQWHSQIKKIFQIALFSLWYISALSVCVFHNVEYVSVQLYERRLEKSFRDPLVAITNKQQPQQLCVHTSVCLSVCAHQPLVLTASWTLSDGVIPLHKPKKVSHCRMGGKDRNHVSVCLTTKHKCVFCC